MWQWTGTATSIWSAEHKLINFRSPKGAYDTTFNTGGRRTGHFGEMDVFVTKVGSAGQLIWSTYLGGPNYDKAYAVEVDANGYVYVAGRGGDGFPTTDSAVQPEFGGGDPGDAYGEQDAFVIKITARGCLARPTSAAEPRMRSRESPSSRAARSW